MRVLPAIAIAAMGLWPSLASAVTQSDFVLTNTQDLYDVCSVGPDDPLRQRALDFCEGFLVGAVSYHDAISDRKICSASSATSLRIPATRESRPLSIGRRLISRTRSI